MNFHWESLKKEININCVFVATILTDGVYTEAY